MKTALIMPFISLAFLVHPSCERQRESLRTIGETMPGNPDRQTNQESIPLADTAGYPTVPEEIQPPRMVAPVTLNRIFREAEEAFSNQKYSVAVAKYEELLKLLDPDTRLPNEMLYFNIGLGNLLGGEYPEAATAFGDCIRKFPKGEYTSRAYLGLGRACMMQDVPRKKIEALEAFKKAADDPKQKSESDLWISRMSRSSADPQKAEQLVPPNGP